MSDNYETKTDHDKLIELSSDLRNAKILQEKTLNQIDKIYDVIGDQQKAIDNLRSCQLQKLNMINETINSKFNEIKDVFKKHCEDEDKECKECAEKRDDKRSKEMEEMKGLVKDIRDNTTNRSTFQYTVMFFVAIVGFIATLTIANTNYIAAHKEKTVKIEEMIQMDKVVIPEYENPERWEKGE